MKMIVNHNKKSLSRLLNIFLLCSIFSVMAICPVSGQQKIRVQGTITSIPGSKPISKVTIIHNGYVISESDVDGKFAVRVPRDAKLKFHHGNFNEVNIPVGGNQIIDVSMAERIFEIEEVMIVVTAKSKSISIESTDIEIRGNYLHLKTRFRIPSSLLTTDYRYIVQSTVYDVTNSKRRNLRPVVIDGKNYTTVQHRYLNSDSDNDKLHPYIVANNINKDNEIYTYADSMYFDRKDMNNDFRADCFLTLVSYHKPRNLVLMDTMTIAKGTQNIMRFFSSSLLPMNLDEAYITSGAKASLNLGKADSVLIPDPEMKLMGAQWSTNIEFEIGKSTINYDNPINKKNIDAILSILSSVRDNEDATIKSISMVGYASPDGDPKQNQLLADRRTETIFNFVTQTISADALKHITLSSKGIVQPWSKVVELVEQDKLPVASKLRKIIETRPVTHHERFIRQLPEYKKIISSDYLPKLRKIEYTIDYSIFRNLTDIEIAERYRQNKKLSRYEYFRLMLFETDDKSREQIEDNAIKDFPNFTWALNRVAIRTLLQGDTNLELLDALSVKDIPMTMVYNQTLMALKENNVSLADSLVQIISEHPETVYLRAVVDALGGDYLKAYPVIGPKGGLNEVLLMLGLKYNTQAYEKTKVLVQDVNYMKDAKAWYINALCANRLDDITTAMSSLNMALELDPSLSEIAEIDSDLMDIYEILRPKEKEGKNE